MYSALSRLLTCTESKRYISVLRLCVNTWENTWSSLHWDSSVQTLSSPFHFSSFFLLAALPSVVLALAEVWHQPTLEWKHEFDSCHKHALSNSLTMKPFNDPGAVWTPEMENTFSSQFFLSQEGWGGVVVGNAHATLCLSPLSPRGVKARRAMSTEREKGCDECSNRWDESSVLVRYVLLLSCCNYLFCFLLFFTTLCLPVTFVCIVQLFCPSCHILFTPHLPVSILFLPFPQAPLFVSASFYLRPYFFLYYMPCSWNVAQNHINTLLSITHSKKKSRERKGKHCEKEKKLSVQWCLHTEKRAVSCWFLLFFYSCFYFRVTTKY